MFGYVMVNRETLPPERQARFRACYCGLCRTLRRRHGYLGALTLSNDMTFLSIALSSLYEPDEDSGRERCPMHVITRHDWANTAPTEYAADMNVALAYHLCLDNWRDDKRILSYAEAALIKRGYNRVKKLYPEKCARMEASIRALSEIESRPPTGDIDEPTNIVGELIGDIFKYKDDEWAIGMYRAGSALGRFIYIMDAYDDLAGDIRRNRYNPLKPIASDADFEKKCLDILTMLIAECTEEFELLPMLRDIDILRNILYSGVWNKYAYIQSRKEKKK